MATFGDIKISTINGGPLSGMRNAVINGNFAINQRGVSGTVTLSASVYGHDRFKAGAGGCTYTFATSENVTTLTITAGTLIQVIEGANLLTDTYTLTFTGTAQGKIGAGSFGASGITGSVTGGTNLNVEFNTGTVSLVQLERGSVATPFEFRSIGQELGLCQRYFYSALSSGPMHPGASLVFGNSTFSTASFKHPTTMRSAPSVTFGGLSTNDFFTTLDNVNFGNYQSPILQFSTQEHSALRFSFSGGSYTGSGSLFAQPGRTINISAEL